MKKFDDVYYLGIKYVVTEQTEWEISRHICSGCAFLHIDIECNKLECGSLINKVYKSISRIREQKINKIFNEG